MEELTTSSPRVFFRPERARSSVATWGGREGVGEIQNRRNTKLGLSWDDLDAKRELRGGERAL